MRKLSIVAFTLVAFILAMATAAMAADPFVGTWKWNPAKSKFPAGARPYRSFTLKLEAQEFGLSGMGDGLDGDGNPVHTQIETHTDGKDHPVTGNRNRDAIAATRVDALTISIVSKKEGKEVGTERRVISADGKTLTITSKTKNDKGEEIVMVRVLDKQ